MLKIKPFFKKKKYNVQTPFEKLDIMTHNRRWGVLGTSEKHPEVSDKF